MIVESFHEPPPPDRARALADFERQFTYPLGPGRSFRIEHGDDYARFYRAAGEVRCFVAVERGWSTRGASGDFISRSEWTTFEERVLGVLAVAIRPLRLPDGGTLRAAYIGDLKVAPEARRGTSLLRLARAAEEWARPRADVAFGVVMDGTPAVPAQYTGRASIPSFVAVTSVLVLRFSCAGACPSYDSPVNGREEDVRECFRRLSSGRHACPPGHPAERSATAPAWLLLPDGSACGCLEDTRRAKRLVTDDGQEMVSAHLSCFAWRDLRAGAMLLRAALARAAALGFPALFVAVPRRDADALEGALKDVEVIRAPATVYAYGLPGDTDWNINSSEI